MNGSTVVGNSFGEEGGPHKSHHVVQASSVLFTANVQNNECLLSA